MKWVIWIFVFVLFLVVAGLFVRELKTSQVVGHAQYRFNMAWIVPDSGVTFVSYDPVEKSILVIPFPTNLAITSRNSGEYSIASLYKLGAYEGQGGAFARQKIQGFMRVPVPGYLVAEGSLAPGLLSVVLGQSESNLSTFDALLLLYRLSRYPTREVGEDELIRAGVVEDTTYHADRLQEYVGTRLFDWGIAGAGASVTILNESGEDGLGSDLADFLSNLGFDVVMVKSGGNTHLEQSEWQVGDAEQAQALSYIFESLFGLSDPTIAAIPGEYRSEILIKVGTDAKNLF